MNILIVTHSYAPDPRPRAYRWTAIAQAWASRGIRVDIVTTGRRGGEAYRKEAGVHVHCVGERIASHMTERHGITNSVSAMPPPSGNRLRGTAKAVAKWLYDATWKQVYWPDYACLWYPPALREARRLCRSRHYDGVISVSHPFTGHLVGLALRRAFPDLRWVVDMGDAFSLDSTVPSNNISLYRQLNKRMEQRVLDRCDAVSVTVAGCKTTLVDEFSIDPDKVTVIPPLLSLAPPAEGSAAPFVKNGSIDLVYLGVLYAEIRRPDALLSLLERLLRRSKDIRLHFVGDIQGCDESFSRFAELTKKSVFRHGPIARSRVAATMASADVLINIGNSTSHQLPSKLVEYVASGKPILNIVAEETDTSVEFLADYPRAYSLVCPDGSPTEAQVEEVIEFLERPPQVAHGSLERIVDRFHAAPVTDAYSELITGSRELHPA